MRKNTLATLAAAAVFGLAGTAWGQNTGTGSRGGDKPAKGEPPGADPRRPQRPERPDRPRGESGGMIQLITDTCKLTPEQQTKVKELVEKHNAERANNARSEEIKPLLEELKAAQQSHDTKKIEEVRAKMKARQDQKQAEYTKSREDLYTQIAALLTPEQKTQFEGLKTRMQSRNSERSTDPRMLQQAVERIKLGDEQKQKVDAIFAKFREDARNAPRGDPQARTAMTAKLKEDVLKELTKEQVDQVNLQLAAAADAGRARPRDRGREGRRERGAPREGQPTRGGEPTPPRG